MTTRRETPGRTSVPLPHAGGSTRDIVPVATGATYLQTVKIGNFGVMRDRRIGSFGPGFNIVYGPNEVGKTTIAAFIAGVLFGWDELRAHRDGYRPLEGQRSGSLVFRCDAEGGAARTVELKRVGAQALTPSASPIVADIDKTAFRTLFSLTGDELRGLRSASDLVARLLNVEAGTRTPPTKALAQLREQIAAMTDERAKDSLPALGRERLRIREELQRAHGQRSALMQVVGERRALETEFNELTSQERDLADHIEQMEKGAATLQEIERRQSACHEERKRLKTQQAQAEAKVAALTEEIGDRLANLGAREERSMRSKLTDREEERLRLQASEEMAAHHLEQSREAYERAKEEDLENAAGASDAETPTIEAARPGGGVPRTVQLGISAGIFALLLVIGVPLFLYGRSVGSLSIWMLGIGLVGLAVLIAASTLLLAFRPQKAADVSREEQRRERLRDAAWIVRQDEARHAQVRAERDELDRTIAGELAAMGLDEADGSPRRARELLDEARGVRAEIVQETQRQQAIGSRLTECDRTLDELATRRAALLAHLELGETADTTVLAEELERRRQQARALRASLDHLETRRATVGQQLAEAIDDRRFDELKLAHQELRTRIADDSERLCRLLLARRQLEAAITTWGSRNQPNVYAQASAYLQTMTGGRWESVVVRADGRLLVRDRDGAICEPSRLSLGTVQQLYLAMRVALLKEARTVGRSIPVIADDILVNFDTTRQRAALTILGSLAETRQVILLTCHEELLALAESALDDANCGFTAIELEAPSS